MLAWIVQLGYTAGVADEPPPTPAPAAATPAGRPRKRRRQRYTIRIDGQLFHADSEAEALAILERAQALAEVAARSKADEIVERALPKAVALGAVKPIAIKAPTVTVSDSLRAVAEQVNAAIARTYADESAHAELRLLLALMEADEDDDELLLLH